MNKKLINSTWARIAGWREEKTQKNQFCGVEQCRKIHIEIVFGFFYYLIVTVGRHFEFFLAELRALYAFMTCRAPFFIHLTAAV
jgi:hypothetical protein